MFSEVSRKLGQLNKRRSKGVSVKALYFDGKKAV